MGLGNGGTARRWVLGTAVCLSVALGSVTPALACGETQQATPRQAPTDPPPLAVGDSVLADTVGLLAAAGYEANGAVCRTVDQGLAILKARGNALPSLVVFALGTNGGISDAQVREALAILGPSRRLVLVTPHHGDDPDSPLLVRAEVSRYAPQTVLLDWDQLSSSHPDWFAADGVHLGGDAGIHAYASMIISALPYATAGQVQAIPTPPPAPAAVAPAPRHHPPAINVFRRAARAMARHIQPGGRPAELPAVVLPAKPGPGGGLPLWTIVAIAVGGLALVLLGGVLARWWYVRRRPAPVPPAVAAAAAPGATTPVPAPPPSAPAPVRAPAEIPRRRPRLSPRLLLVGAALAALGVAAARTSRLGLDRRRR